MFWFFIIIAPAQSSVLPVSLRTASKLLYETIKSTVWSDLRYREIIAFPIVTTQVYYVFLDLNTNTRDTWTH